MSVLTLKKVRVHNLKEVDLTLPLYELIVFTGVSGSGKSSLAFSTIYAEGQRRYIESLSSFAKRHLGNFPRPDAELIDGIAPTIAIEQKTSGNNPRSTIGTMTGIYDFLRVLFARVATAYCPESKESIEPQSKEEIFSHIEALASGQKALILSPYARQKKAEFVENFATLLRQGFTKVRLDREITELTETIKLDGTKPHDIDLVIDRLILTADNFSRMKEGISSALDLGKGLMSLLLYEDEGEKELFFSMHAYAKASNTSYAPLEPQDFSFNHPLGMCPHCEGLGSIEEFDLDRIIDPQKSIEEDCCIIASSYQTVRYGNIYRNLARLYNFSVQTPWKNLSPEAKKIFLYGNEKKWTAMQFKHPIKNSSWTEYVGWKGVIREAKERLREAKSALYRANIQELMHKMTCPVCQGSRLKPYPSAAKLGGKTISELTALSIDDLTVFFQQLQLETKKEKIASELLKEIRPRLSFLMGVGLGYLAIERTAPTLSGGEAQRVRLAAQVGTSLVGAIYILDEPSIGLHPRDSHRLIKTLKALKDLGNTVIVVEHDEETIKAADYIVDIGPLAGSRGGKIVAQGSLRDIFESKESLTGAYLSGKKTIPFPKKRRKSTTFLKIEKASHHNLKDLTIKIPLQIFVAITGVSGSGKSSLITDTLYPALASHLHNSRLPIGKHKAIQGMSHIDKIIAVDQSPIGRTPRSNPATYVKLFDDIRDLFSALPDSLARGFSKSRFSFNLKEGSCPHCKGLGSIKIDMDFLEDAWTFCHYCKGTQFDETTLSIRYKGKNIHDILEMTIEEASLFFEMVPAITRKLEGLLKVGLGYLRLGQPSPSLSGGEAQRIKLAKELSRKGSGKTLYILDEPTTGLHFDDIKKLLDTLDGLVDKGNSLIVIEHNMDLVKRADWVIDLGPEGGSMGGEITGEGSPETLSLLQTPTGKALHAVFFPEPYVEKSRSKEPLPIQHLSAKGVRQNNLKNVSATLLQNGINICTGPSGSGKSSFAFETLYAEGQRRYIESMSPYARQFVEMPPKPIVERIDGLSPSIGIEQKNHAGNPRSTVGTITEIYDYLRILYANIGTCHCPETGEILETISTSFVSSRVLATCEGQKVHILSPLQLKKEETFNAVKEKLLSQGFLRIRLNGTVFSLDEEIPFEPQRKNALFLVIDRFTVTQEAKNRLFEAIELATTLSAGSMIVAIHHEEGPKDLFFNLSFAAPSTGKSYTPITAHSFSFNIEEGMCPSCMGLGVQWRADLSEKQELFDLTPLDLLQTLWGEKSTVNLLCVTEKLLKKQGIDPYRPLSAQSKEAQMLFLEGSDALSLEREALFLTWRGLSQALEIAMKTLDKEAQLLLAPFLKETTCLDCEGTRLSKLARFVEIQGVTLPSLSSMMIEEALLFIKSLVIPSEKQALLQEPLRQIVSRLELIVHIGIGYLSLNRKAPTLSSGEMQRIRLAKQLGSSLGGCLYVLDEPTVGLHPYNNEKVGEALIRLKNLGNTLLLVEHDPLTLEIADYILDFGPKSGKYGGEIIARGSLEEIKNNPLSLTGAYLSGKKRVPLPERRRKIHHSIRIENASLHHLKNLSLEIPMSLFTCITGVSGAGKSTLMRDLLYPAAKTAISRKLDTLSYLGTTFSHLSSFQQVLSLEQNPIGHTNRADISTYVDLLTPLRQLFASMPLARAKGLEPKHFSFNHKRGMCTTCQGHGYKTIELQFLSPVQIPCESCCGYRLNPLSLEVSFKEKHLGNVLKLTPGEALDFLPPHRKMVRILETLVESGLGYIELGQQIATLSGGEAQRLRLARELSRPSQGKTLYLLDEPTVGLHSEDIVALLKMLQKIVDKGHTLVVIEHNLDLIAAADYIIDLGPDAGRLGGEIVALGTPEEVAQARGSRTAPYLKKVLANSSSMI